MMIVSIALPANYLAPTPPPGWILAQVEICCEGVRKFSQKIGDKIGPRQAAGIVEDVFDKSLKLFAVATDADGVDSKSCEWVPNANRTGKPGWSAWK